MIAKLYERQKIYSFIHSFTRKIMQCNTVQYLIRYPVCRPCDMNKIKKSGNSDILGQNTIFHFQAIRLRVDFCLFPAVGIALNGADK
jgi:hypothetical protein